MKPINKKNVLNFLKGHKYVVTIEEHNIIGGLGSVISEIISETDRSHKLYRLGVKDTYSKSGSYDYLKKLHGIDSVSIAKKVKSILK